MAVAAPLALALSVAGTLAGGIEQNDALRGQAKVDEQNAQLTQLDGEQQALQTRRDERQQVGEAIAGMAGSGVQLGSGTASDLVAESAYQRELEILNIRTRSAREANNLLQSAADKKKAGKAALVQAAFGAVSSALSGVSNIRAQRTLTAQRRKENSVVLGSSGSLVARKPGEVWPTDRRDPMARVPRIRVGGL